MNDLNDEGYLMSEVVVVWVVWISKDCHNFKKLPLLEIPIVI